MAQDLDAAHHAPGVGFMQPWRFIRVTDAALRLRLHQAVEEERLATAHEPMLQRQRWAQASAIFKTAAASTGGKSAQ